MLVRRDRRRPTEFALAVELVKAERRGETLARAIDPALDGADRAAANLRRLIIGETGSADEDEGLALLLRHGVQVPI